MQNPSKIRSLNPAKMATHVYALRARIPRNPCLPAGLGGARLHQNHDRLNTARFVAPPPGQTSRGSWFNRRSAMRPATAAIF